MDLKLDDWRRRRLSFPYLQNRSRRNIIGPMTTPKQPDAEDPNSLQIASSLRFSEARLAGILASAMDAIITVDEQQHIVLFNSAAEKMFNCPASDAMEQPLDRFIPARYREAHREHI